MILFVYQKPILIPQSQKITMHCPLKDILWYGQIILVIPKEDVYASITMRRFLQRKWTIQVLTRMFSIWNCHWKKDVRDYLLSLSKSTSMWVWTFSINVLGNIRNQDPVFTILLGDFNARWNSWWIYDITDKEGTQIESIISLYDISQPISETTHILQNSLS